MTLESDKTLKLIETNSITQLGRERFNIWTNGLSTYQVSTAISYYQEKYNYHRESLFGSTVLILGNAAVYNFISQIDGFKFANIGLIALGVVCGTIDIYQASAYSDGLNILKRKITNST